MTKFKIFIFSFLVILFISGCRDDFKNKKEARGIWMSRYDLTGRGYNPEAMKNIIRYSFSKAKESKFNMIIFQVRGNGDAFYKSDNEPWSKLLTGKLGKDPGWDPLQFAIETAHSLGLEIHAWINTFPAWRAKDDKPEETTPRHIMLEHPEWIVCDKYGNPMSPEDGYISASPGIPAVRDHITNVVMDIVRKYDVDGIHFDYIRYPEGSNVKGYSHDRTSVDRFRTSEGNPKNLDWENWQRDQVNEFVRKVYDSINSVKPWIKMSASVIGNYKKTAWNGFNIVYQDPKVWMAEKKIDFIVPMTYLQLKNEKSSFENAIADWKSMLELRNIYPGLYSAKADGKNGWGWQMIWDEIKLLRESGFPGFTFFAMSSLFEVWEELRSAQFPYYANIPCFNYKNSEKPSTPGNLKAVRLSDEIIELKWADQGKDKDRQPYYFNIFRSDSRKINFNTAENLISVTKPGQNTYIDSTANKNYYYSVSALNRNNLEGEPSDIISLKELISKNK